MITRKDKLKNGQIIACLFEGKNKVEDVVFLKFRKFGFVEIYHLGKGYRECNRWRQVPAECLYLKSNCINHKDLQMNLNCHDCGSS